MENKKGFTLVELLAVIAILAIIVVIAYPLITGVIDESRRKTLVTSAESVIHAAELAYANSEVTDGTLTCLSADSALSTYFAVDASKDPWQNAITVCAVVMSSGTVDSVSYGNNVVDSGSYYLNVVAPANLDASSTGIFTLPQ